MAPPLTYYLENADSVQQGGAGFRMDGGKADATLYLMGSSYPEGITLLPDLPQAVSQIIGATSTAVGSGTLNRTLPLAHPLYPWLFASGVKIRGFGTPYKADSAAAFAEAIGLPYFTAYPNYEFNVEYTPRPYVVAGDNSIPLVPSAWADNNGTVWPVSVAAEWMRYANWWYDRKFESITCRQGQMKFRAADGSVVNGVPYADMPRLFMPDSILNIIWHQVPYRYITSPNSYIDGLIGLINQRPFTTWYPGELLYIGYTAKPYTPPVQNVDAFYTGTTGFIYSAEKLADVHLQFLRTKRYIVDSSELFAPNPGTANAIQAGWNLQPWLKDRLFHYVSSSPLGEIGNPVIPDSDWKPLFNSTELGLLFTDPDAPLAFNLNNSSVLQSTRPNAAELSAFGILKSI